MRIFLFLSFCFFYSSTLTNQINYTNQEEIITNETIINMVKSKISKKIIFLKIKDSPNEFDLSASGIIGLKSASISDDIILKMFDAFVGPYNEFLTNEKVVELFANKISRRIIFLKIKDSPNDFDLSARALIRLKSESIPDDIILKMFDAFDGQINESLTNEKVIDMFVNKVSRKIIILRIERSQNKFDSSSEALIELKNNKIWESIIVAMMEDRNPDIRLDEAILGSPKGTAIDTLYHDDLGNLKYMKKLKDRSTISHFLGIDGNLYSLGDTLVLGEPYGEGRTRQARTKKFKYIHYGRPGSGLLLTDKDDNEIYLEEDFVGENVIIERIRLFKRLGKVGNSVEFTVKLLDGMQALLFYKYFTVINGEFAIKFGEIYPLHETRPMSREEAIELLRRKKEEVDLGITSKKEYDELMNKLTPIIKNDN